MGCAYFSMTRGMGWGSFWLIFIGAFFYMIWAMLHGGNADSELKVTSEAAGLAPVGAIEAFMQNIEAEGYIVEHVKNLEQDPENINRVLIEYEVIKPDQSEKWTYLWAWEVPAAFTSERIDGLPDHVQDDLRDQCRLIAVSEAAEMVHEELLIFSEAFN